jgi:hypothetical protein
MKDNVAFKVGESLEEFEEIVNKKFSIFSTLVTELSHKVDALQSLVEMNGLVDSISANDQNEDVWPSECSLDITCLAPDISNLYMCELTPDDVPYRWTGPGKSTRFIFRIDRSTDRVVTFRILGAMSAEVLTDTFLLINGVKTVCDVTDVSIVGSIPAALNGKKPTEIVLVLGNTISPKMVKGENDTRLLGVALAGVAIK